MLSTGKFITTAACFGFLPYHYDVYSSVASLLSCPQNVAANTYHERVVSGWPIALRLKKGKKKQTRKEVRKEGKENRSKIKCLTYSINLSTPE